MTDMSEVELAQLGAGMPPTPERELRCHPMGVMHLREEARWVSGPHTPLWKMYDQLACPVYEDPSMGFCAWEIREDGEVIISGNTATDLV